MKAILSFGILLATLTIMPMPATAQAGWTMLDDDPAADASCEPHGYGCTEFANPYIDIAAAEARQDASELQMRVRIHPAEDQFGLYADDAYHTIFRFFVGSVGFEVNAETGKSPTIEVTQERWAWVPIQPRAYTGDVKVTGELHQLTVSLSKADLAEFLQWPAQVTFDFEFLQLRAKDAQMGEAEDRLYPFHDEILLGMPAAPRIAHAPSSWKMAMGLPHATAPSLALGDDGTIHAAFVSYDGPQGLYYARMTPSGLGLERLADVALPKTDPRTSASPFNTSTSIAVADHVFIAFFPKPGQGGGIRLLESGPAGWSVSDPGKLGDGTQLRVDDTPHGIAAVAASRDRVVMAISTLEPPALELVERTPQGWMRIDSWPEHSLARIAIDERQCVHVAAFDRDDSSDGRKTYGDFVLGRHCEDDDAHVHDSTLATDVLDRAATARSAAQDGSFDVTVTPSGAAWFVYENDHGARRIGSIPDWSDGAYEGAFEPSPLRPVSSAAQSRFRIAVDGQGQLHAMSGGDEAQLYAVRTASGLWTTQEAAGFGMFDLQATRDGFPVVAGIDVRGSDRSFVLATAPGNPNFVTGAEPKIERPIVSEVPPTFAAPANPDPPAIPSIEAWTEIATIGTMVGLGFGGIAAKRAAYRAPRWFFTGFAALGGFSRLNKDKLLEHQVRELIVESVRSEPGATAASVRDNLDLAKTTFFYHLSRLTKDGLVRIQRNNKVLHLYPGGGALPPPPTALLNADQEMLSLMRTLPPVSASQLARQLHAEPRTVRLRLQRLARNGAIQPTRNNPRDIRWTPVQR